MNRMLKVQENIYFKELHNDQEYLWLTITKQIKRRQL